MGKAEFCRVQCLTVKAKVFQQRAMALSGPAVNGITDERVANGGHVYPDLVRPSGFKPALDERCIAKHLQTSPVRPSVFPFALARNCNLLSVRRRSREGRIHDPFAGPGYSGDNRKISPLHRMRGKLLGQSLMGNVRLGNDQ